MTARLVSTRVDPIEVALFITASDEHIANTIRTFGASGRPVLVALLTDDDMLPRSS